MEVHRAGRARSGGLGAPPALSGALLLSALALTLYAPSLGNGLTNWDDLEYVTQSPFATQGLAGIPSAWTGTLDDAWYPLTHSVYCLIYAVAKDAPGPYHALQWVLFALAAALLPMALETFGLPRRIGFWAGLLWLVHPFRVESVAWIANLKDTLSLVLVVGSFVLLGRGRRWTSALLWVGALLAKSMVFPVALLVPLLEMRRGGTLRQGVVRAWPWLLPALGIALVAAVLHLGGQGAGRSHPGGSLVAALPSVLWLPWRYLGALLLPSHPQAIYSFVPVGWAEVRLLGGLALWAGWAGLLYARRRALWPWLAGTLGWGLPFAAVTGLVPLAFPVADRYTLLPSIALAAGLALAADALARRSTGLRWAVLALLLVVCAALALRTELRIPDWRSSVALWEADRPREPKILAVRVNLAGAYGGEGRWGEAISELEALRRLDPFRLQTVSDLFFACAAKGKLAPERIDAYVAAIDGSRRESRVLRAVAEGALKDKQLECAAGLAEALYGWERSATSEALMAEVEVARGRYGNAVAHAQAALSLEPAQEAPRVQLVLSLIALKRFEEALAETQVPARDPRIEELLQKARAYARPSAP